MPANARTPCHRSELFQIGNSLRTPLVMQRISILLVALFGCALAQFGSFRGLPSQNAYTQTVRPVPRPQPNYQPSSSGKYVGIRSQHFDISPDGSYTFSYETDNGIAASESGSPRATPDGQAEIVQGTFTYSAPDGTPINVAYTADENGFHPEGAHLPTPPPIPEGIKRALAVLPQGDDDGKYNPGKYNQISQSFKPQPQQRFPQQQNFNRNFRF